MTENYEDLMEWVSRTDSTQPDIEKHQPIIDRITELGLSVTGSPSDIALVLGGAATEIEQLVLASLGFEAGTVICVDRVPPRTSAWLTEASLDWRCGYFPEDIQGRDLPPLDVVVSLAASRFFPDPYATYRQLLECAKPGGLVIIDFLDQPVIRRGALQALGGWAKERWAVNQAEVLAVLREIARLSITLGPRLSNLAFHVSESVASVGLRPGLHSGQNMIYEMFFPFWYRPDATEDEVMRLIGWQLLYNFSDGSESAILQFAKDLDLEVLMLWPLTPDTNVLIARAPR